MEVLPLYLPSAQWSPVKRILLSALCAGITTLWYSALLIKSELLGAGVRSIPKMEYATRPKAWVGRPPPRTFIYVKKLRSPKP